MFDNSIRHRIDPVLNRIAETISNAGISANTVTWIGFVIGMASAVAIAATFYFAGLILLLLSRLCDGLDGAVARAGGKKSGSDLGGYLDIVLDFAFYGAIPLAFVLADPSRNAVAGAVIIFIFYINGASFLTFALMAEKRGMKEEARGSKSLLYTVGLAEATETICAFVLMCLFPASFAVIAYIFSAIVLITTVTRFILAYRTFSEPVG